MGVYVRLAGLAVFGIAAILAQQGAAENTLRRAIELHQAGRIDEAIPAYREYLNHQPGNVQARSNLGAALSRAGRYEEATAEYQLALEKDPRNLPVLLNLALVYYKTVRIPKAAETFAIVHSLEPANRQALFLLADCHLRMGENAKVVDLLSPLEKDAGEDPAFIYLLGTALIRDQKAARGQVLVDRILRHGDSAEAHLLLGTTKMNAHDYKGALEDLTKAVGLNPKLPEVHAYYGLALLSTGDEAGAAAAFRKELEANPNDFNSNLQLGVLLKQDQNYEQARKYFEHAGLVRPGNPGVRYQLATLDMADGKVEEARRNLEALTKEVPQFVEAHVSLATVYYRLKRKDDGDRERAVVLKLNSEKQAREPGAVAK